MTDIGQFLTTTDPPRLDATLIADHVASEPTLLGRGVDGDMYVYTDGVYVRDEHIVTKRVAKALGGRYSATVCGQVNAHLLNIDLPVVGLPELPRGYLDYIVLENGIYWWEHAQLDKHSPALGALTKLPITLDESAVPHTFIEWLNVVLGRDPEVIRHVWEVIGYLLMTGNPLQKIFLLFGEGGNGKGTLMRVLRAMLGRENYSSLSMHQLVDDKFASSGLYGKTANISGDLSSKFLADPQILKEITGGDSIAASRKFGQYFEFVPYAVPLFAANEYFRTSDSSSGWRRRWEVIDFTVPVEAMAVRGEIPALDEQLLLDEIPGIFNLAMDALRVLMARGKFSPPATSIEATERLHNSADPLMLWFDEDDGVYRGPDESSACSDVYKKYAAWCRRNGYTASASGTFGARLKQLGITKTRPRTGTSRVYHYEGVSVMLSPSDA